MISMTIRINWTETTKQDCKFNDEKLFLGSAYDRCEFYSTLDEK